MKWLCCARPASVGGRTCYHFNEQGTGYRTVGNERILCCERCGATKRTSDSRLARRDLDKTNDPELQRLIAEALVAEG